MVHPQRGAISTNSSSPLLSFVNILTCTEHQNQLGIRQEICVHLAKSCFPELGHNTKPLHDLLQPLALSSASLTQYAESVHNYLHLANISTKPSTFLTSPSYLFIHYKRGLSMGKTHGSTSHTCYINPKPKNLTKGGDIP
jgi:hypothetical protein